jgi:hypothetical protein
MDTYNRYETFTHTHTLRVPVPIGYPTGGSNTTQVTHYFTSIDSTLGARIWDFDLLNMETHVDYNQCLITRVNGGVGFPTPLTYID